MCRYSIVWLLLSIIAASLVYANQPPMGEFEQINQQGEVMGWAYDPDHPRTPIDVRFLVDEINSIIVKANLPRAEGGFSFSWSIPNSYRDDGEHRLEIFAIDIDDKFYPKLAKSPVYFRLQAPKFNSCSQDDVVVIHGATRRFFAKEHLPLGSDCFSLSELRECNDGKLSGSFGYADCLVDDSCYFNSLRIPQGESITAFKSATGECLSETRTCNGDILSGSFAFASCEAKTQSSEEKLQDAQECSLLCSVIGFFKGLF